MSRKKIDLVNADDVNPLLTKLLASLDKLALDERKQQDVQADSETVKAQLRKEYPKESIIRGCITAIKECLEESMKEAVASGAGPLTTSLVYAFNVALGLAPMRKENIEPLPVCAVIDSAGLFVPAEDALTYYDVAAILGNELGGLIVAGWFFIEKELEWMYCHEDGSAVPLDENATPYPKMFDSLVQAVKARKRLNDQPTIVQYSLYIWFCPSAFDYEMPFPIDVKGKVHPLGVYLWNNKPLRPDA